MNGKIIKYLSVAVGLLLYGAAFYLYDNFTNMPDIIYVADGNFYKENNADENENKFVMVRGKIAPIGMAEDKLYEVKAPYPIMLRKTEMYQYFQEEKDGSKRNMRGWQDHKIKSFTDEKGQKFENPQWPSEYSGPKFFYTDVSVNGGNLPVSRDFIRDLWKNEEFKDRIGYLKNLSQKKVPKGFVHKGNHFLKESGNKYHIGDIRIYYKAFNYKKDLPEFTFIGRQINGRLKMNDRDCRVFYKPMELEDIRKTYNEDAPHAAMGAVLFGTFFLVFGIFKAQESGGI